MPRPWWVSSPERFHMLGTCFPQVGLRGDVLREVQLKHHRQHHPLPLSRAPGPQTAPHGFGNRTGFCSHPSTGGPWMDGFLWIQLCQPKFTPCAPPIPQPDRAPHSFPDTTNPSKWKICCSQCLLVTFDWNRLRERHWSAQQAWCCARKAGAGRRR